MASERLKYRYLYQTKENITREGVVEAASRAEAYASIRKLGIRPQRVIGDDPKPRKAWRRWTAIVVLAIALIAVTLSAYRNRDVRNAEVGIRQQILGDQALIDMGVRTGWSRCFRSEGERMLAAYAQPGWLVDRAKLGEADELVRALDSRVNLVDGEPREFRQVKAIVESMKDELRQYLADGGSPQGYLDRLHERQLAELGCYERAARRFEKAAENADDERLYAVWLKINADLREMGVKTIPMPERLAR